MGIPMSALSVPSEHMDGRAFGPGRFVCLRLDPDGAVGWIRWCADIEEGRDLSAPAFFGASIVI